MGLSQEVFVRRYEALWEDFRDLLDSLDASGHGQPVDDFPAHYRTICRHLAVARSRGYSPVLRRRLEQLVQRGHTVLYQRTRRAPMREIWAYVAGGFARDVRGNWPFLVASLLAFALPFLAIMAWVIQEPPMAVEILGWEQAMALDEMYSSPNTDRWAGDDVMMFGFYISNNTGIALRTFGAGVIFGIGSLAILLFNGLFLGAASGYIVAAGHGANFWPFVIGHGSFELTAIVIAGMAGLKIGAAPIWPGRRGRVDAVRQAARESVGLILGFSAMMFIAAFIEAFWSPRLIDANIRYAVGFGLWLFVFAYFALAGRRRATR